MGQIARTIVTIHPSAHLATTPEWSSRHLTLGLVKCSDGWFNVGYVGGDSQGARRGESNLMRVNRRANCCERHLDAREHIAL